MDKDLNKIKQKISKKRYNKLLECQKVLSINFNDISLLNMALTHMSFVNENPSLNLYSYQRLEFLGDSVLNIITSEYLYINHADFSEGQLSYSRNRVVNAKSLKYIATKYGILEYVLLGASFATKEKDAIEYNSMYAQIFEAIIGAYYLDSGMSYTKVFLIPIIKDIYGKFTSNDSYYIVDDFKSRLNVFCLKNYHQPAKYIIVSSDGVEHRKTYKVHVMVNNQVISEGSGFSIRSAEQIAAHSALKVIKAT